ncbi:hypothetical protein [Spirosoma utsteinense]|uniref:N-acetyltransferase domain-containing protein n=1 Tax=Spirosoma utsteinense TaxID=2585773 RepID=A0ABR6W9Z7_9BACT|nr:hypothetical protein [Spirosoma utsteinense]MBC3787023.1 hypothetical protein [Spirosoma utsteinense]MBC3793395.1 hypothetical protein [Spirosoma utsteinense]
MVLIDVDNREREIDFLTVHIQLNRENPNWIRPLDKDVLEVFDPKKNKSFRDGEVVRWILKNEEGQLIGRIAAFISKRYKNKGDDVKVGGVGFFDCIDDQRAASRLFDEARGWLQTRGVEAMDGPINFGERDKWWGLLVSGFEPPLYTMNYNPPYYQALFETYGFQNFYNQLCFRMTVASESSQLHPKFYTAHAHFTGNPDFKVKHLLKSESRKYASDFSTVYNKAWSKHEGNKEMGVEQAVRLFKSMAPILDEKLIWFAYHKDEPVAMWLNIPDINQIVSRLDGQFNAWAKVKFFVLKLLGVCTRFVGIAYGIVPEFQGTGIDYFMIVEAEKVIKSATSYKDVELQWNGDFNPKMLNISRNLGAEQSRVLVTYRYLFDRQKPFHRHPVLA